MDILKVGIVDVEKQIVCGKDELRWEVWEEFLDGIDDVREVVALVGMLR